MKQTQKSLLSAGVFLVIALVVAGIAAWVKHDEELKQEQKEKVEKVFAFDKAKVVNLQLEKDGKLVAEVARPSGDKPWAMVRPVKTGADQANVNAVVDKLAELKQKRDLGDDTDAKQPGLDAPRWKITLLVGDKPEGLEVGADNSFDNTTYVRKLGEKTVRMIDGFHKSAWEKTAFDLRDKRVLGLDDNAELKAFTVVNDQPYTLRKEGADWKLTGPGNETPELADASAVDRIVSSLKGLRATAVAAETGDDKQYGLADPKVAIEWEGQKVSIGQAGGKTYARRSGAPAVLEIDSQIIKDLQKSWFELQDKTVAKFDREQVRSLEIDAPGAAQIVIGRSKESKDGGFAEEKFTVEAPASGAAQRWKVSSALHTLGNLRAVAFAGPPKDLSKFGLDKPRTYLVLGDNGKELARLRIGKAAKDPKRLYALADGASKVVEVEQAAINDLPKSLDEVLEPPPKVAADGGPAPAQAAVPK